MKSLNNENYYKLFLKKILFATVRNNKTYPWKEEGKEINEMIEGLESLYFGIYINIRSEIINEIITDEESYIRVNQNFINYKNKKRIMNNYYTRQRRING